MNLTLYKGNSNVLLLEGLQDHRAEVIADATVTATISRGAAQLWTGTLAAVVGSAGDYEAVIAPAASAAMTVGETLTAVITATADGLTLVENEGVKVRAR
jgi:hypothetical protein